VFIHFLL